MWTLNSDPNQSNDPHWIIAVPSLVMAFGVVVLLLYLGASILIPFFFAIFFMYLLRPIFRFFTMPFRECRRNIMEPTRMFESRTSEYNLAMQPDSPNSSMERRPLLSSVKGPASPGTGPPMISTPGSRGQMQFGYQTVGPAVTYTGAHRRKQSSFFTCTRAPVWLAMLITISVAVGMMAFVIVLSVTTIQNFEKQNIDAYEQRAVMLSQEVSVWAEKTLHVDASQFFREIIQTYQMSTMLTNCIMYLLSTSSSILFVLLFMLYLMPTQQSAEYDEPTDLQTEIDDHIQRYIGLKSAISALAGILIYFVLVGLNVPMAFLFAIFTFFLNFIPNVGAMVAVLLPLPIVLLDPNLNDISRILALVLPVCIHAVIGNVVEPVVFGDSLELHPVTVLLSLAFWYTLWGAPGALLSVPITASFRILLSHISHPYAQFVLALLSGRLGMKSTTYEEELLAQSQIHDHLV
eukprot:gb/GEZN01007376.1/.p1 GENE.gb/GEZN01007376.1/~~gb/GEZN01007376.1/.p1  ORF type:complete len:462 (+),score=53.23 gb/GEZN01007376.1/:39-1424(+)